MVKCPYCGGEYSPDEFIRHVETHKRAFADMVKLGPRPLGVPVMLPSPCRGPVGSLLRDRSDFWLEKIKEEAELIRKRAITRDVGFENIGMFTAKLEEDGAIAEVFGLEDVARYIDDSKKIAIGIPTA